MMVAMSSATEAAGPRWIRSWSREEGAAHATARLRDEWGIDPSRIASAPGRLTIIGEYTDISDGVALPTVIPHRTYVAVAPRSDDVVRIATDAAYVEPGAATRWEGTLSELDDAAAAGGWAGYSAGVLWALLERGYDGHGVDMAIASCVPLRAGLAASAALTGATALAINDAWRLALATGPGASDLAEVCIDAENDMARGATAGLDQHTVLRCAEGEAVYLDFATRPVEATPCPLYFPDYGLGLLIVDTGVPHAPPTDIVRARMRESTDAAIALGVPTVRALQDRSGSLARIEALENPVLRRRARHIFTENERVDLVRDELSGTAPAHERFVAVGKAMYRSHASLELDFEVSSAPQNLAVDTAFRAGALGARMIGSGMGGSVVALVRRALVDQTARAIEAELVKAGLPRPSFALV